MRLASRAALALATAGFTLAACVRQDPADMPAPSTIASPAAMDALAERYVKLVLAVGRHDANYVDAYYGPSEWKAEVDAGAPLPLETIRTRAQAAIAALAPLRPAASAPEMDRLRHRYLERQLASLVARVEMLQGRRYSFDEESRALYDAVAPTHGEAHFDSILAGLDRALPGSGSLQQRYAAFRQRFVVPRERLDTVFATAIAECRRRTMPHVTLPPDESFRVEYVKDKPWSGYNWYQGGSRSLIQVNTDIPISIDRAVDLACHEGYPGHHVYNALLERALVRERGWQEFTVYPLFSPQSLIAEGTANYGIDIAFPGEERLRFERDVLFPLAGLDPGTAAEWARVRELNAGLSYAGNEAARRYLDGRIDANAAAAWLERYALSTPESARQRVRFFDTYRSYVINYNLGQDLVREYAERHGASPEARWKAFVDLLASPRLPSGLR